jgi:hypothetical protein
MSLSSQECPICFCKATLVRSKLDNYECTCDYYVHRTCYERWRAETGTDRLCLICDVREVRHEVARDEEGAEEPLREQEIIQYGAEVAVHPHEIIDYRYRGNWGRALFDECAITVLLVVYVICYLIIVLRNR